MNGPTMRRRIEGRTRRTVNPPKSRLHVLKGDFSKPLSVVSAEPVGNYAIRLHWSDNHASGIYSYTYLSEISPPE